MSTDRMRLTESLVPSDVASLATSDVDAQIKSDPKSRRSVTQNACKECRQGRVKVSDNSRLSLRLCDCFLTDIVLIHSAAAHSRVPDVFDGMGLSASTKFLPKRR